MENKIRLKSGWWVSPTNSLYFTSPDGVIYDRCGWMLTSRSSLPSRFPHSLQMTEIFTDDEWERYSEAFR